LRREVPNSRIRTDCHRPVIDPAHHALTLHPPAEQSGVDDSSTTAAEPLSPRLPAGVAHPQFRLFLTMEITDSVPAALLALCCTFIYEPPAGMRASIVSSLEAVATRMERAPRERARLHLLLAWTHALLLERQAFVPVGWSKPYAFSAADLACAHDILDRAVDAAASDRCAVVQTW
jgi:hypothetical protein